MKKCNICCLVLSLCLISSAFAGCQSSEEKDKTSSEKQTAASVQEVSSETSTAESLTTVKENSSLNNSQTVSNNTSIGSGSSRTTSSQASYSYAEKIYPEENYSLPKAPYAHPYIYGCDSVEDVRRFILETDPNTFWDGYFFSLIKLFKENGYIVDPHYAGNSLFDEEKFASASVGLHYEKGIPGVGYLISFETQNGESEDVAVYYLKDEWIETAINAPVLYDSGKKGAVQWTKEDAIAKGWIEKKIKANGKEFIVNYHKSNPKAICYVYDEYMIYVYSVDDIQSFIENFSLKKIPLEK